jgi:hypothetical protein
MAKSKSMITAIVKCLHSVKQRTKSVGVVKNGEYDIQPREQFKTIRQ